MRILLVVGLMGCLAAPIVQASDLTDALLDVDPKNRLSSGAGAAYGSVYGTGTKASPLSQPLAINQMPTLPTKPAPTKTKKSQTSDTTQKPDTLQQSLQDASTSTPSVPTPVKLPSLPSRLDRSQNLDTYNGHPFEPTYNGQPLDQEYPFSSSEL